MAARTARLAIRRGGAGETPREQVFEIPFEDGDSVLDGLVRARALFDDGLAFRYSCFNANVCRECLMQIDGVVQYACIAKLRAATIAIAPIANRPLIRDLVTDTLPAREKL
jgi:succinate dehydrogenase/fumarate reductase-like Fe-S protein